MVCASDMLQIVLIIAAFYALLLRMLTRYAHA